MATATLLTAEDLYMLPESFDNYELWRGVLRPMTRVGPAHALVMWHVTAELTPHIRSQDLGLLFVGDPGVVFERGPDTVLCPDIVFIARERLPKLVGGPGILEVVPDLAIEILSPSHRAGKTRERVAFFLARGVPVVWVCDPRRRTVRVHGPGGAVTLSAGDELQGGEALPGFRCPVAAFFAGL